MKLEALRSSWAIQREESRGTLLFQRALLANTEKSALISANEFLGPDLDQCVFTAASCKDDLAFHHFGINQEQRLIPE